MPITKKICVCSVQVPFVRGGAEIFTENLVTQLQKQSHQVDRIQIPFQTLPLEEVVKGCLAWRLFNLDRIYNDEIDLVIGTKFPSYMVPHRNKVIWLVHQYREIYDLYGSDYSGASNCIPGHSTATKDYRPRSACLFRSKKNFHDFQNGISASQEV